MEEIKSKLDAGLVTLGAKSTMKALRNNKVDTVYTTTSCSEDFKASIEKYDSVKVNRLDKNNRELGTICKKTFPISVLAVLKEK